ncbi:MAG: LON peptidase substrate-binding domain-containing protein [Proteobacteria bacterium]|nr:LON peptidase substrate-binding domain-containing protein [Pseudomonadota bacterium]
MLPLDLFPVDSVLFPDGIVRLKVFETRYIDMVSRCLKSEQPFGLCLIRQGAEVGKAAEPCKIGTLAHITEWDMPQQGVINITVQGGRRFRINDVEVVADQSIRAQVSLLDELPREKIGTGFEGAVSILQKMLTRLRSEQFALPHRSDDVDWVANRLAELLPMENIDRQNLLEQDDALLRLQAINDVLQSTQWKPD